MAPSIGHEIPSTIHPDPAGEAERRAPDPVIGAGITLLGILLMGIGGSQEAHYAFDVGVLIAVLGAGIFVLFVALSVMRQRQVLKDTDEPSAKA